MSISNDDAFEIIDRLDKRSFPYSGQVGRIISLESAVHAVAEQCECPADVKCAWEDCEDVT